MANVSSSNGLEKRPKLRFPGFDEPYRTTPLGEIASLVNRTDPKSNAPIMMLSAGNGFIMQSEKYSRDNAGQSLKKYILLKQGELAYNHGASKAKQFGCCYELTEPEARIKPQFPPLVPLTPQWSDLPQFPVDALPDTIRRYVSAVAEHSQTAPDMAAVISLGVLAVCLQGKYKAEGTPGYYEPLSLYTVVIATLGERKSSVMRDMTKYLYEYEQEYNQSRSLEIRENRLQREALERQISGLQKKLERREDRETELELRHLQEQLEDMPELKPVRFFADDCSSEAFRLPPEASEVSPPVYL